MVRMVSTWSDRCNAEGVLDTCSAPASDDDDFFPVQFGNCWEYSEAHLTVENYRAKAIFEIAAGMNDTNLMPSSQEFVCFRSEEEYNTFAENRHRL